MDKPESICTCKQCKKNFPAPSKRFSVCSPECQAILDAAYVRPPRPTITLTCQYCAKTVTRKAQRYEFGKYCSRPCAYAGRAITRAAKAAEEKARKRVEQAQRKAERDEARAAAQKAKEEAGPVMSKGHCHACCGEFIREVKGQRFCDDNCRIDHAVIRRQLTRQSEWFKKRRRVDKAKRRARDIGAHRIDPIAVFERDEWKCYICHVPTPSTLRGSYEPNAPELEHIVSLSDGGTHTWDNVACSCRACNMAKGSLSFVGYKANEHGPQTVKPKGWHLIR